MHCVGWRRRIWEDGCDTQATLRIAARWHATELHILFFCGFTLEESNGPLG